jgi:hypothetical protein
MKTLVVGITGKARSGKDTLASIIQEHLQPYAVVVHKLSMASPMKTMVSHLFWHMGYDAEEAIVSMVDGELKEVIVEGINASPRKILQTLGTDWGRNMIHEDLWIECMKGMVNAYEGDLDIPRIVLIPDIRFDNEAEKLCDIVIRIERKDAGEIRKHASENGVDDQFVHYTIFNDDSIKALEVNAMDLVDIIKDAAFRKVT